MQQTKKMVINPFIFLAIIPVGVVILLMIYDFCYGKYEQKKLDDVTKEIITTALSRAGNKTLEDYKKDAQAIFYDKGYDIDDLTLVETIDGKYIITTYGTYNSVKKQLINAFKSIYYLLLNQEKEFSATRLVTSKYIARFNQYKEVVVEKSKEKESLDDEDGGYNSIIKE